MEGVLSRLLNTLCDIVVITGQRNILTTAHIRSLSSQWSCELLQCDSYGNVWTKTPCHSNRKVFFLWFHVWFWGACWVYLHECMCSHRNHMGTWHSGDTPDGDVANSLPGEEWCHKCHIVLVRCTAQMDWNQVSLSPQPCNFQCLENSFPLPSDSSTVKLQNRKVDSLQLPVVKKKPSHFTISTDFFSPFYWATPVSYTHLTLPTRRTV